MIVYIYIYIYIYAYIYLRTPSKYIYIFTYVYTYLCIYMYIYIYIYIHTCLHTHTYIPTCTYTFVCIYACTYICIHIFFCTCVPISSHLARDCVGAYYSPAATQPAIDVRSLARAVCVVRAWVCCMLGCKRESKRTIFLAREREMESAKENGCVCFWVRVFNRAGEKKRDCLRVSHRYTCLLWWVCIYICKYCEYIYTYTYIHMCVYVYMYIYRYECICIQFFT